MVLADFLNRLKNVSETGGQYSARCPAHDDNRNSLSVSVGADKRILCNCHAGCAPEDITAALGLTVKDLFEDKPQQAGKRPEPVAVYTYPTGAQKLKYPDKRFTWRHPDGAGGWIWNRKGVPRSLYVAGNLNNPVFVVEGEKDADSLHALGYNAVSGEDGAGPGKWRKEYTEQLKGLMCVVLHDNDDIGREYGEETAAALHGAGCTVYAVDLVDVWPEIPEHGDVSDMIEVFGPETAAGKLAELMGKVSPYKPPDTAEAAKDKPYLVRSSDVPYEPPRWTIPPYFQRGKGTLVQGDNGTGKTAFLCAVAAHVSNGRPILDIPITTPGNVIIMSVEDDLPVLRGRVEADGGDLDKCYFVGNAAGLSFNDPAVEAMIKEVTAKMIIFDPLQAFLGAKIDMFRSNETRPALAKLFEMCERNDCACVIIAHMGKAAGDKSPVNRALGSVDIPAAMRSIIQIVQDPENEYERIAVHVKCSNAPKGQSLKYTIGERGGVTWLGYSPMTVEDVETIKKRQERKDKGLPYEQEPLVQVFNQLITDKPGGGFWSYTELKKASAEILGYEAYGSISELRQRLDGGLSRELLKNDGLIVTHGERGRSKQHGVRIQRFRLPDGYQEKIPEIEAG